VLLVEARPLNGGRCHLGEMHRGGFVVFGEGSVVLVEELDGAELAAVQGGK
jgi:hypothetical protein